MAKPKVESSSSIQQCKFFYGLFVFEFKNARFYNLFFLLKAPNNCKVCGDVRPLINGKEPALVYQAIVCTSCQVSVLFPPVCIIPCSSISKKNVFNIILKLKNIIQIEHLN
jgi:hypothetical protein